MKYFLYLTLLLLQTVAFGISTKSFDVGFYNVLLTASTENKIAKDLSGNYTSVDLNLNKTLEKWELENISELNVGFQKLTSLKGVLLFSNLTKLVCNTNQLTTLDVQGLSKLEGLYCQQNLIKSLDVSELSNLQKLCCASNNITALNYFGCEKLSELYCAGNPLTELDLRPLPLIHIIYSHSCNLEKIYFNDSLSKNFIELFAVQNAKNLIVCADKYDRFSLLKIDSSAVLCYDCDLQPSTLALTESGFSIKNTISIYPNPTADYLYFSEEIKTVKILDISGKLILDKEVNGTSINLSNLAKGTYTINLIPIKGNLLETTKIIIQ